MGNHFIEMKLIFTCKLYEDPIINTFSSLYHMSFCRPSNSLKLVYITYSCGICILIDTYIITEYIYVFRLWLTTSNTYLFMHCKHQSVTVGQIQIKYQCQIVQLKEHLTRDLGALVRIPVWSVIFSPFHYNWCPTKLTPPMGKNPWDDDLQGQNSINGGGNCDSQASLNTGPR